jgi:molybdenum cofactor cytidylyltransferase
VIFGSVPVTEAEDCLLAHSLRQNGLTFKKGRRLSAADILALKAAGLDEITVARLDTDDCHEDEAADRIAAALAATGLRVAPAFTGRANLFALHDGLTQIDAATVTAINAVDEAITLATLPPFHPVRAGDMVATLKIIPFSAPSAKVRQATELAHAKPLSVAAYSPMDTLLIQTVLPGLKPSILDGTSEVTRNRLATFGSPLQEEKRISHDRQVLAAALKDLPLQTGLVLIAGASAIIDRADVIPAAILDAGGRVDRFGLPVDPGNLLLLGRTQSGTPVIGLPGCARSPKLNGLDWILQRLHAGLTPDDAALQAMGVGGLLSEIITRPQPRGSSTAPRAPHITGLLLAAGQSRRMGRNKLMLPVEGEPLIRRTARQLLEAQSLSEVIVVTGHEAALIETALSGLPVKLIGAADYAEGLSRSLKAGLAALPPDCDGVLIALADMPLVSGRLIDRLAAAFNPLEGRSICRPAHQGKAGHPILWGRQYVQALLLAEGDQGGRDLLKQEAAAICEIVEESPAPLLDLDTPEAYEAFIG